MIRVIGLGSGRCGTTSLAALLASQRSADAVHERFPHLRWSDEPDVFRHFPTKVTCDLWADVGFYYLPHVRAIWEKYPSTCFVCLKRDKEQTVASWLRYFRSSHDPWRTGNHVGAQWTEWDASYPSYPGLASREEAARVYWDDYYEEANRLSVDPRFRIFNMDDLNTEQGVVSILRFAGIKTPRIRTKIRTNCTVR